MSQGYLTFPNIDSVLISIGPIAIRWYGLMYLFSFMFAIWFANKRAQKPNSTWNKNHVSDLWFVCFLGVILGGRIGYVLFYQFDFFLADPLYLFKIWAGGMSFHGGLLGVITAMFWYAKKNDRTFFNVADFVAPSVPFGIALGRLGNFINGELWGRTTNVPWAMVFPTGGPLPRHPSQLYEMVLEGIVLFFILNHFIKKTRPVGAVSGLFLILYGSFRFIIEYVREPDAHLGLIGNFISMGQILSLPMIVVGTFIIYTAYNKHALQNKKSKLRK